MSNSISKTPCDRLLYALGLEQTGEYYRTFFTQVSDMLEVRMSTFSDCIRRGKIVTGPVLEAAKAKGINPDFIKHGKEPVYLGGFAETNGKNMNTLPEKITIYFTGIDGCAAVFSRGTMDDFTRPSNLTRTKALKACPARSRLLFCAACTPRTNSTANQDGRVNWKTSSSAASICDYVSDKITFD